MEGFIEKEQDRRQGGWTRRGNGEEAEEEADQIKEPLREQLFNIQVL